MLCIVELRSVIRNGIINPGNRTGFGAIQQNGTRNYALYGTFKFRHGCGVLQLTRGFHMAYKDVPWSKHLHSCREFVSRYKFISD